MSHRGKGGCGLFGVGPDDEAVWFHDVRRPQKSPIGSDRPARHHSNGPLAVLLVDVASASSGHAVWQSATHGHQIVAAESRS